MRPRRRADDDARRPSDDLWSLTEETHNAPGRLGRENPERTATDGRPGRLRAAAYVAIVAIVLAAIALGVAVGVGGLGRPGLVLRIDKTANERSGQAATTTETAGLWNRLLTAGFGGNIEALVIDPNDPAVLYVGMSRGVFKSVDQAQTWARLPGLDTEILSLFVDPASSTTIYALALQADIGAGGIQLLRSDDAGHTWTDLTRAVPPRINLRAPAILADVSSSPSTIYVFDQKGGMWRSADRGETWMRLTAQEADRARARPLSGDPGSDFTGQLVDLNTGFNLDILVGRADPTDVSLEYAATLEGVYKSIDGGDTWNRASRGLELSAITCAVPDPFNNVVIYTATSSGIFKTRDGGGSWSMILGSPGCVAVAPSSPITLYAWTDSELLRSDDGGVHWTKPAGSGLTGVPEFNGSLLVAVDDPDTVLAVSGDPEGAVFRSGDGGETWQRVLENCEGIVSAGLEDPSVLYAVTSAPEPATESSGRLARSTDLGITWAFVGPKQEAGTTRQIVVDPNAPDSVYVVDVDAAGLSTVFHSVDGGRKWEKVTLKGAARYLRRLVFDPLSLGTLYALTMQRSGSQVTPGIYRSSDGGATWEDIGGLGDLGPLDLLADPAPDGTIYAVTLHGLFKWAPPGS